MTFSHDAWERARPVLQAIERHPFVLGLGDGTLSRSRFDYYMAQDALYLVDYGRSLALAGSQAGDVDSVEFWSQSAIGVAVAERELHASFLGGELTAATMSPTCRAYTSYLLAVGAGGSYPVLTAALLPCFWIYEHIGALLLSRASLTDHPYAAWIRTYADPDFAAASARARELADEALSGMPEPVLARAHEAFATCARYEWMFWDAAWRQETWPV
ncbi:thiaminase II [Calidifontibacter sp. DB0510]|uniref:Thiaminase II n=1 Tax=Metallococcus carri TaxID=1656884 RepID=A0A967AYL0_9MICO|nr:TenA family protein [Metallococcus carri]NHN55073.1 thiaminase II [Metallococcus carri]NOP36150.1 TenA family protein [Calidifontibacter sp. DB2511S]